MDPSNAQRLRRLIVLLGTHIHDVAKTSSPSGDPRSRVNIDIGQVQCFVNLGELVDIIVDFNQQSGVGTIER